MLTMTFRSRIRQSAGFTLVELLVGLLILGLMAGVVMPQVVSRLRQGDSAALAQNLSALTAASYAFRTDLGKYPRQLSDLATAPAATQNSCRAPLANVTRWKGPYLARPIPVTGLVTGRYVISNVIIRTPEDTSGTMNGVLYFEVLDVDREVADDLEAAFDGNADFGAGMITWTASGGTGTGRLLYAMPVRGC
jgi:type II secretion system protein G